MAAQRHDARLVLIRHAPIATDGILCGRTDVAARIEVEQVARVRALLPEPAHLVSSPALRCRQTCDALFGDASRDLDERLWEQSFGIHDGRPYGELPDLGVLSNEELAKYAAPEGESFDELCARTAPALRDWSARAQDLGGPVVIIAHAGVIRSAIGMAMGYGPAGLAFEMGNLSATHLRAGADGPFSVISSNGLPA